MPIIWHAWEVLLTLETLLLKVKLLYLGAVLKDGFANKLTCSCAVRLQDHRLSLQLSLVYMQLYLLLPHTRVTTIWHFVAFHQGKQVTWHNSVVTCAVSSFDALDFGVQWEATINSWSFTASAKCDIFQSITCWKACTICANCMI